LASGGGPRATQLRYRTLKSGVVHAVHYLVHPVHHLVRSVHDPWLPGRHLSCLVAHGLQPTKSPCADHPLCQFCQGPPLCVPTLPGYATSGSRHSVVRGGLPQTGVGDQAGSREWSRWRVSTLRASILVAGRRREFRLSRQVCILARGEAPKRGGCGTHSPTPLCGPYGWGEGPRYRVRT
jgi:hypothetical protein